MPEGPRGDVTQLLTQWADGDRADLDAATRIVYADLRKIAESYLQQERGEHTLQPTALIHEAYLRLVKEEHPSFENRKKFFAFSARLMRQILVDHARSVGAEKRHGMPPDVMMPVATAGLSKLGFTIGMLAALALLAIPSTANPAATPNETTLIFMFLSFPCINLSPRSQTA